MTLFGFEIQRIPSRRMKPLARMFLMVAAVGAYYAITVSDFFADYRFGNSIVPREDQLTQSGPYVMGKRLERRTTSVIFYRPTGTVAFSEDWLNFNDPNGILSLVDMLQNKPVAYLWLYDSNPLRKVWKIVINDNGIVNRDVVSGLEFSDNTFSSIWGPPHTSHLPYFYSMKMPYKTVLSYSRALLEYHSMLSLAYFLLKLSLVSFALFLWSTFFTITRKSE
jgi:hypothetical protein